MSGRLSPCRIRSPRTGRSMAPARTELAAELSIGGRGTAADSLRPICSVVGLRTFRTSPIFSQPAIIQPDRSTWRHESPWKADVGKTWWLWCHDSPSEGSASTQLFVDWSLVGERPLAEEVADRVHAPRDVVVEEEAHEAAPHEPGDGALPRHA